MKYISLIPVFLCFLNSITSITFPSTEDGPQIAVLEFKKVMKVFDPEASEQVESISLRGRGGTACLDFNYRNNEIYFTDLFSNQLIKLKADGGEQNQKIIFDYEARASPEGIGYDWIHNNLYLCLWGDDHIDVLKSDTGEKITLINTTKPRDIEVDPRSGWMYYIAGWEETARLVRCGLDGQNEEVLTTDIERPFSLSLDYSENKLYWTEKYPVNKLYSIDLNGENKREFLHTSYSYDLSPSYLTVSREYVYWTAGYKSRVYRRLKHGGTQSQRYNNLEEFGNYNIRTNLFMGILAVDPQKQPETASLCGDNNGGCSHFCLPSPVDLHLSPSFTCHCPDDMELTDDNKTCNQ
ncbi:hypothetical protein LOTGIDRAFT_231159 [Lottia gigantea]|uniref:Prolow-density lipoprotein receptor-related protein 1-like beta-propeller domain-containing protein n=1 Tax=Lottia gigantea TaxID=225164 RepID=V4AUW3_LOTGI|nr:hypothetical protein LOTGIDRAFT_231159 [Lottia gigantea]ESO98760.1 hypothetical protein LOTGIDRAFT_231159 [Lottia gigantea]